MPCCHAVLVSAVSAVFNRHIRAASIPYTLHHETQFISHTGTPKRSNFAYDAVVPSHQPYSHNMRIEMRDQSDVRNTHQPVS